MTGDGLDPEITHAVSRYYSQKLRTHGTTPRGVDWRDARSQELRFAQLHDLFADDRDTSVIDFGCGYAGFLTYLRDRGHRGTYLGLDLSAEMVEAARPRCEALPEARAVCAAVPESPGDYAVASGIFNVRFGFGDSQWRAHIRAVLDDMHRSARLGFAFNCLTAYSDPDRRRDDLYYADPLEMFDHCKRRYAQHVSLVHDYGLYEFTIVVRSQPRHRP